jgi:SAM-dependent methyltransferase
MNPELTCPVCHAGANLLDVLDFNRSCSDLNGKPATPSGLPIYYALCPHCGFCFAPAITQWTPEQFTELIYNQDYVQFDPDCIENRPKGNAALLMKLFDQRFDGCKHLDYGGGDGLMSQILREAHWDSVSYDPYRDTAPDKVQRGGFDLITAFEVFEHVPDPQQLMAHLRSLLAPHGLVLFSTLLSDTHIAPSERLHWWYAAPRNGHISLFSEKSLRTLAGQYGWHLGSFSSGMHLLYTQVPTWAAHLVEAPA